jgi:hypothetical protein
VLTTTVLRGEGREVIGWVVPVGYVLLELEEGEWSEFFLLVVLD